ncbi:hypothetical protein B1C78_17170 [Thioalkalivibrio denitrificans]|uniref:PEP-CTERM protein-sorting domain-containing protein n=1 Tax=Thioalkalivibrio denitrificans TaxID=108003 RepID=A0A1V3N6J7_9GAMM|nr:hypothetical protein [Thioalkalivibrio denitrificans]OOG20621.1 hypothetical protein B1C78_17170 [Thioalkalivibrio denitrificans]
MTVKMCRLVMLLVLTAALGVGGKLGAAPIMYVHDSQGNLGTVNVQTGDVDVIGNLGVTLTDIAFDPSGNLFGVSFNSFYSVNVSTAETNFIGFHGINAANALVFGLDGTLYSAGNLTTNLFTIDVNTGAATSLGNMGFSSGGDLAFHEGELYLASSASTLVNIDLSDLSNTVEVGPFGVANVYGLATGDDGVLYGVGGTQIFAVDTATGAALNPVDFSGQGLGTAWGQSFFTEAGATPDPTPVPVPAPWTLMLLGFVLLLGARSRRVKH